MLTAMQPVRELMLHRDVIHHYQQRTHLSAPAPRHRVHHRPGTAPHRLAGAVDSMDSSGRDRRAMPNNYLNRNQSLSGSHPMRLGACFLFTGTVPVVSQIHENVSMPCLGMAFHCSHQGPRGLGRHGRAPSLRLCVLASTTNSTSYR
jgi:hypothetical protein